MGARPDYVLPASQFRLQAQSNLTRNSGGACSGAIAMLADNLHVNRQKIDRLESAVLLSLVGGGLALCVLGATAYDIARAFSMW